MSNDFKKIYLHRGSAWEAARWHACAVGYAHYFLLARAVEPGQFYQRAQPVAPVEQGFDKPSPTGTYRGKADRAGLGIVLDF